MVQLICGGLAGSTAALFTTPFDVVKTKLQTQICSIDILVLHSNLIKFFFSFFQGLDSKISYVCLPRSYILCVIRVLQGSFCYGSSSVTCSGHSRQTKSRQFHMISDGQTADLNQNSFALAS
ncbi:hypothetical protein BHE74_00009442 [Ensete ventricosum]|nr:hypothetical protein BHE74_00009442 [Ensete ventricosum]